MYYIPFSSFIHGNKAAHCAVHFWEHINPIICTVQVGNKGLNVWVFFPVHIKLGRNVFSENVPEYVVDGATCYGDLGAPLYKVRKLF